MPVEIEILREASDEIVDAFALLLPQLSASAKPLDHATLTRLAAADTITVLLARAQGRIAGTLTLVIIPLPTGARARIEDVVVDEAARGQGVAAALTTRAVELARTAGARTVDLTSRPSREAANRLYERLGFQRRDSTLYRYALAD
ncbi:GNAT family N-acetyltransferase [Nonomuraea rosea]|uniref:GNAT family N-acetyltransferase n=1 Tax=Nonomuraea rosea TaxID=638574 RepID=A0ABP6X8U1_9ACTN